MGTFNKMGFSVPQLYTSVCRLSAGLYTHKRTVYNDAVTLQVVFVHPEANTTQG